jgi:hypothetical protein
MKKIDLHGCDYDAAHLSVIVFIENNIDNLPLKIITGNSNKMQNVVREVADKFKLKVSYQNHHNLGTLIITEIF